MNIKYQEYFQTCFVAIKEENFPPIGVSGVADTGHVPDPVFREKAGAFSRDQQPARTRGSEKLRKMLADF